MFEKRKRKKEVILKDVVLKFWKGKNSDRDSSMTYVIPLIVML